MTLKDAILFWLARVGPITARDLARIIFTGTPKTYHCVQLRALLRELEADEIVERIGARPYQWRGVSTIR